MHLEKNPDHNSQGDFCFQAYSEILKRPFGKYEEKRARARAREREKEMKRGRGVGGWKVREKTKTGRFTLCFIRQRAIF